MTKEFIVEKLNELENPYGTGLVNFNELITTLDLVDEEKVHIVYRHLGNAEGFNKKLSRAVLKVLKIDLGFKYVKLENPSLVEDLVSDEFNFKTILVASGKGGVGKSQVTVGLARALVAKGYKVGIVDCDIYGYSIPKILNLYGEPEVVNGKILPLTTREGIEVFSTQYFIEENENKPIVWRAPKLLGIMKSFFTDVAYSEDVDFVLVDLPPGTGDIILNLTQFLDHDAKSIVVTTPQEDAAHVAIRTGSLLTDLGFDNLGVVENMSYYNHEGVKLNIFGDGGGQLVANELDIDVIAEIPIADKMELSVFDHVIQMLGDE